MFLRILMVAALVVTATAYQITSTSGSDSTLTPGAKGAIVVGQTMNVIKTACVFDDDKLFMRRLAHVESADGSHSSTFRTGFYGGIWQVTEAMFNKLKEPLSSQKLSKYTDHFNSTFGINWETATWRDCTKPLYSALAAILYILLSIDPVGKTFPRDISAQGTFWVNYYHNGANANTFTLAAERLNKGCNSSAVDLVFILDGSGSVGRSNFTKMKTFVIDVIQSFDVDVGTKVGVLTYSSSVVINFHLNRYNTKLQVLAAVNMIRYPGGGTSSDLALNTVYQTMFTTAHGTRNGVPHVGIFLTDGRSNNPSATRNSAAEVHKADITMFAVGVGSSNVGKQELAAIASPPECLYLILLDGFSEVGSLKYAIEKGACDAPIIIDYGQNGTKITYDLTDHSDGQNCKVKVPDLGVTVQIDAKNGTVYFFVSTTTYPSEAYFDVHVIAEVGKPGVIYLPKPATSEIKGTVYCHIMDINDTVDSRIVVGIAIGDQDHCRGVNCQNGGTCVDNLKNGYTCSCAAGFNGGHCEQGTGPCLFSPCVNGACQYIVNGYTCVCEPGYTGSICDQVARFDCPPNTPANTFPCTLASRKKGKFYFAHVNADKFVQCDNFGVCFVKPCALGTIWNHPIQTCTRP